MILPIVSMIAAANNFDDRMADGGSFMKKLNSPIISMIAACSASACVFKDRFYTFIYLVPVALKCQAVSQVILLMIIFCLTILNRSMNRYDNKIKFVRYSMD